MWSPPDNRAQAKKKLANLLCPPKRRGRRIQRDKRNGNYFVWIERQGTRKYFNLGPNRRKAEKELDRVEKDVASGRISFTKTDTSQVSLPGGPRDLRIEELAVRHLEWVREKRSKGTFENRKLFVVKFLGFVGESMVSGVTRMRLEEFHMAQKGEVRERAEASARRKEKRILKETGEPARVAPRINPNAGNEAMVHVKAMLRWGEEMGMCALPPRLFPEIRSVRPETRRISGEELARLMAPAPPDFRDLLAFGLLTGLRPLELRDLRQDQIRHAADGQPYLRIGKHKTSRSAQSPKPRTVPLCPLAEEIVERQVKSHPQSPLVFLNAAGTPYTRYSLRNRLRRLCRKAGLKDADGLGKTVTPYGLRHAFASVQSDAGVESTALASLMGHSTTRLLDRYVSNTFEHHRKAVGAVESELKRILSKARKG